MRDYDQRDIAKAVAHLQAGHVIAYPTEAVFGFGCDPYNFDAVNKILEIKSRSITKGFILVAATWEQAQAFVRPLNPQILTLIQDSWPGPNTWALPVNPDIPAWLYGDHDTIAIRVSDHPIVRELCQQYGGPIISTSANKEGMPPASDYQTVKMNFLNDIDFIVPGHVGKLKRPTTIRDAITGEVYRP